MGEELTRIANTVRTTPKGNGPLADVGGENFERAMNICAEASKRSSRNVRTCHAVLAATNKMFGAG
jgi:hypothetical protein